MPFTIIKGEFVPEAGRPDGDSIRFRPTQPTLLSGLRRRGRGPRLNASNGTIQLRFEGIDTMESSANGTHSTPATQSNLELCGVPTGQGTAPGWIATNQVGPNGRPIAFVFAGAAPHADGDYVHIAPNDIDDSVNLNQLLRGHAYPLFYDTLYFDLRDRLSEAYRTALDAQRGVWAEDQTQSGVDWAGGASLDTMPPIFPKLWRRLDKYSRDRDIVDPTRLDEFHEYLQFGSSDRAFVLSERRHLGFHHTVVVNGATVRMTHAPDDLVFDS